MSLRAKSLFLLGIIFLLSLQGMLGQGFDWEYSARMPFEIPRLYVGLVAGAEIGYHTGNLNYIEQGFSCVQYPSGSGSGYVAAVCAEWWWTGNISVMATTGYHAISAEFAEKSEKVPLPNKKFLQTEYFLSTSLQCLGVEAAAKWRISGSHTWLSAGVEARFVLGVSSNQGERVLEPSDFLFKTQPPSTERVISAEDVFNVRTMTFSPVFSLGYDKEIGKGMYLSPRFYLSLPAVNQSPIADWRIWTAGIQCSVVYGL